MLMKVAPTVGGRIEILHRPDRVVIVVHHHTGVRTSVVLDLDQHKQLQKALQRPKTTHTGSIDSA